MFVRLFVFSVFLVILCFVAVMFFELRSELQPSRDYLPFLTAFPHQPDLSPTNPANEADDPHTCYLTNSLRLPRTFNICIHHGFSYFTIAEVLNVMECQCCEMSNVMVYMPLMHLPHKAQRAPEMNPLPTPGHATATYLLHNALFYECFCRSC